MTESIPIDVLNPKGLDPDFEPSDKICDWQDKLKTQYLAIIELWKENDYFREDKSKAKPGTTLNGAGNRAVELHHLGIKMELDYNNKCSALADLFTLEYQAFLLEREEKKN
jgi:hypothetical protein